VASWQNSLMALSMLLDQAELTDHGVILEYQLGNTSRRLDAMLTGPSPTSAEDGPWSKQRTVSARAAKPDVCRRRVLSLR